MAALLTIGLAAQSQPGRFYPGPVNDPRQIFAECAEALPRLYERRDFDSIAIHLRRRRQNSPGFQTDLYALHILLEIQLRHFSRDSVRDPYLYYALDDYVRDAIASQSEEGFGGVFSSWDFDARGYYQEEFAIIARWAEDLLYIRRLSNAESFLCQTFAGDFAHPRKTARADKTRYWQMNSLLDGSFLARRKMSTYNLYAGAGIWIPRGKLASFGRHPSITAIGVGLKNWNSELDVTLAFRFVHTANPYTVLREDSIYTVDHFFGGYIGLDYTRYLLHTRRFEVGSLVGIGYDGFDVNDKYTDTYHEGPPSPTEIGSLNLNLGCRFNYYIDPKHYIGLIGRYNFIQYTNPGGTALDGNAVTIDLIVGFN